MSKLEKGKNEPISTACPMPDKPLADISNAVTTREWLATKTNPFSGRVGSPFDSAQAGGQPACGGFPEQSNHLAAPDPRKPSEPIETQGKPGPPNVQPGTEIT